MSSVDLDNLEENQKYLAELWQRAKDDAKQWEKRAKMLELGVANLKAEAAKDVARLTELNKQALAIEAVLTAANVPLYQHESAPQMSVADRVRELVRERDEARKLDGATAWRQQLRDAVVCETAEAIAAWLDEYDPTLAECRASLSTVAREPVSILIGQPGDLQASATDISFDNTCLVVREAIKRGAWRTK